MGGVRDSEDWEPGGWDGKMERRRQGEARRGEERRGSCQ